MHRWRTQREKIGHDIGVTNLIATMLSSEAKWNIVAGCITEIMQNKEI